MGWVGTPAVRLPVRQPTPSELLPLRQMTAAEQKSSGSSGLLTGLQALALHAEAAATAPVNPFVDVNKIVGSQGSAGLLGAPAGSINAAVAAVVPQTPPPLPQTPQSNTGGVAPPAPAITVVNADGSAAIAVGRLTLWQMTNQPIDTTLRIGLPILGYFLWKAGHATVGVVSASAAAVLWANRIEGLNL